jgi:hypothetical protein
MSPADHTAPAAEPDSGQPPPGGPPAPDLLAEPTFEECVEEGNRFFDELKAGKFNGWDVPEGHYVAYYAGKVTTRGCGKREPGRALTRADRFAARRAEPAR